MEPFAPSPPLPSVLPPLSVASVSHIFPGGDLCQLQPQSAGDREGGRREEDVEINRSRHITYTEGGRREAGGRERGRVRRYPEKEKK